MRRFKEVLIIFSLVFVIILDSFVYEVKADILEANSWAPGTVGVYYSYDGNYFDLIASNTGNKTIWNNNNYYVLGLSGNEVNVKAQQFVIDDNVYTNVEGHACALAFSKDYTVNYGLVYADFIKSGLNIHEGSYISVLFTYSFLYNGKIYYGRLSISGVVRNGWIEYEDFNLVYNNDYNYTSNTASFTLQYSNFSFSYFTFLNTDIPQGSTIYGYHLLNYNLTQSGSTYVVHCIFDNTFVNLSNPHYLFWTVHGLGANGKPKDLSGYTSFDLNAPNVPQVPKGVLIITSPKTGDNFASGTTQIPVSVVYGGDVTDVTDPNYNHTSVTVGATHALHNAGYVNLTSYSIINGTTVWSGTLNLNPGEGDGEYTLLASLDRTTLMSDTVTITIGSTTGNPVLDFLKAVWAEFKEWFVKTMKALFVPSATDFSSQIAQGWVQVSNPLPSVTPLYKIDIPLSTALGSQNGVVSIDFKTPITSWDGYPTMQSVIRVGLYTLLVFLIWSMVT